ncbi:MAG: hypothetical protein HW421_1784 [Ignavibacteria bacterium]|nr:hypothetical protein [Ignavibacteria bacterium]
MHRIIIDVNNKKNAGFIKSLLKKFDFVNNIRDEKPEIPKSKFKSWEEFSDCLGIWEGRDITKESLRKMAWRQRTL